MAEGLTAARLIASLTLDTTEYKAGVRSANTATQSLQSTIAGSSKEIKQMTSSGRALQALMRGDMFGAVKALTAGFKDMGGAIATAGAALAGFGLGWRAGKWLDEKLDLSGKISRAIVKPIEDYDDPYKQQKEDRRGRIRASDIDAETKALEEDRLKGVERIALMRDRKLAEIDKRKGQERTWQAKEALDRQSAVIRRRADEDIKAIETAEREKSEAVKKAEADRSRKRDMDWTRSVTETLQRSNEEKRGAREASVDRQLSMRGEGVRVDSMAQMGGMIGGSRAGVANADRQIRIAAEQANLTKRLVEIATETKTALEELRARFSGE